MAAKLKVLFFIASVSPTEAEKKQAEAISTPKRNVVFRNAGIPLDENDPVETADGLAGLIPDLYRAKLPKAEVIPVPEIGKSNAEGGMTPEQLNEWAKTANVAELKQALAHFGISHEPDAKKADLLQLFLNRK